MKREPRYFSYAILLACALFVLVPVAWAISTSLKDISEATAYPPRWIPATLTLENYRFVIESEKLRRYFQNSFEVIFITIAVSLVLGVPAADRAELRRLADLVVHREEGVRLRLGSGVDGFESAGDCVRAVRLADVAVSSLRRRDLPSGRRRVPGGGAAVVLRPLGRGRRPRRGAADLVPAPGPRTAAMTAPDSGATVVARPYHPADDAAPDNHCYKWAIGDKGQVDLTATRPPPPREVPPAAEE